MRIAHINPKWHFITAFTVLLLLVSACSNASIIPITQPEQRTVAVVTMAKDGDYWNTVRMGAAAAAKEFNVKVDFFAPDVENEVQKQVELADQAIKLGANAVVLAAIDYMALGQVVDQASYRQIPVISIDSEVGSTKVKSFVGTNSYMMGRMAGQKWAELTGEQGNVVIMNFMKEARNAEQREEGLLDLLRQYPRIKVVDILYANLDSNQAYRLTKRILEEGIGGERVDGIISLNATSSLGAARAVADSKQSDRLTVVTMDSTPELMSFVQDGVVEAAVVQNPFAIGYMGVKYAVEAMRGQAVPEREETDIKIIDLDNMFRSENQKLLFPFVK